ncbi:MAG TPA: FHA domain-containing protein [Actinomycetota bacterium]|nr:FHA domain-containing protein [Actinomycetota bacterium]
MYCSRCGHPNKDEARFCSNCGAPLHEEVTVGITPVEVEGEGVEEFPFAEDELQPGQALLLVKHGPNAGSTFLLESDVTTAGRGTDSDVFLDDVTVSRKHAELRRRDDGWFVHDVGSLNGTYVNRERVDVTKLASGDELQIGRFKLVFFAAGE